MCFSTLRCSHLLLLQWDWLSRTHCILSEVATAAAWFVSFWFWVGLVGIAGQAFNANGGTIMAHAGNFVLALAVVLLTRLPLVSTHFQVGGLLGLGFWVGVFGLQFQV